MISIIGEKMEIRRSGKSCGGSWRGKGVRQRSSSKILYTKEHDHSSLKVKQVSCPGPSPVLTIEEDTESCYLLLSSFLIHDFK